MEVGDKWLGVNSGARSYLADGSHPESTLSLLPDNMNHSLTHPVTGMRGRDAHTAGYLSV